MDRFSVSSSINIDQLLSADDAEIILIEFNLFSIDSSSAIIFVSNSKIDLQTIVFQDINCKSLIESSNGPVELNELTISTVTCDTCFDILRGTVSITDMDIFDTTGSLIELMEVNLLDINFLNIYDSYLETVILAQPTILELKDISLSRSSIVEFFNTKQSVGAFQRVFVSNSSVTNMFTLNECDLSFSDFMMSNTSASRVYHVSNSIIVMNHFLLHHMSISNTFLFSTDCSIIIDSVSISSTNLESSLGFFNLMEGSLFLNKLNTSESSGSLVALNKVGSCFIENTIISYNQAEFGFLIVNSNVSLFNISVVFSSFNVLFEPTNSHLFVDSLCSVGMNSTSVFDGSTSVLRLNDVSLSKLITDHVFDLSDSTLELNLAKVFDSILTTGFLLTTSANSTIHVLDFHQINEGSNDSSESYSINTNLAAISNNLFNIVDSHLVLSSIILTHSNADLLLTCLHCNGSMNNLLIENSSFTSLFHLDDGSMSFDTTYLTKVDTSLVVELFSSNVIINHLDIDSMRINKSFLYSEFSIIEMSSINAAYIRDASDPLFMFNHSEFTAVDFLLSAIECSIFSFTDSSVVISALSLTNSNTSSVIFSSNSEIGISNSSFHSIEVQVLVSVDNLSIVTIEESTFSMIYGSSFFNFNDSTFSLTLSHFNILNLKHFLSLTSSSASLSNSSIIDVESSQSLINADDSVVTVNLVEVGDAKLETFFDLNNSTLSLHDVSLDTNLTLIESFLIGHRSDLVFKNLVFFNISTPNDFSLIHLSNSHFISDLLAFELLNCTLFEFISSEVYLSNTSFNNVSSRSIGSATHSTLIISSSIFPM
ncbi:hypothetical protein GEMRC1_008286 [Eukaryota sp. GEM-RC1]